MSNVIVKQVIARANAEPEFQELLLSDPDKALADLELTDDEKMSLKALTREALMALAFQGDNKITRPSNVK